MSAYEITSATVSAVASHLGACGFYVSPKVIDNKYSRTCAEATLVTSEALPVIKIELDAQASTITIVIAGENIEVSSYHNNGTGPFFRDIDGIEFMAIEHDAVAWFRKDALPAAWPTPASKTRAYNSAALAFVKNENAELMDKYCPKSNPVRV